MSISVFDDLGGLFHILVNFCHLDCSSDHQKLNVIQKPTFHFLKIFLLILAGGYISKFFEFFNFFKSFHTEVAQNGPQWQILPKSGLDWLKMANFGHFAGFPIFSPKMRLRLTQNGQFLPIHNFSHLLPPKHLIFGEISKISIWELGVHRQIC